MTAHSLEANAQYDRIKQAEQFLVDHCPPVEVPTRVFTGYGMSTRVVFLPAGTAATGARHLQGTHSILVSGQLRVLTEDGPIDYCGPEVFVAPPGTKRAVVALTDCIFSTTIITNLEDADAIRAAVTDPTDIAPLPRLEK
jgi:quercetin dioxygenase-like cupin family protein